jgi:hypothetical protein
MIVRENQKINISIIMAGMECEKVGEIPEVVALPAD